MIYEEFAPPADLRAIIDSFWHFELDDKDRSPILHVVPPDGTVIITWLPVEGFAMVVGPRTEALRVPVQSGCQYFGLRLRPGVVGSVLGVPAPSLRDQNIPLHVCAPHLPARLHEPSIKMMAELVRSWPFTPPDERATDLIDCLLEDPDTSITDFAEESRLGYRQTLRIFKEATGLTPKEFAKLRKIRLACIRACEKNGPGWAEISAESGFSDQSHLSREFSSVFGWTPRLLQEYLRRIEHRNVAM